MTLGRTVGYRSRSRDGHARQRGEGADRGKYCARRGKVQKPEEQWDMQKTRNLLAHNEKTNAIIPGSYCRENKTGEGRPAERQGGNEGQGKYCMHKH